jgi:PPIC-type PPIASE domain
MNLSLVAVVAIGLAAQTPGSERMAAQTPPAKPAAATAAAIQDPSMSLKSELPAPKLAAQPVARVGFEEITHHDLDAAYNEWLFANRDSVRKMIEERQKEHVSPQALNGELANARILAFRQILDELVERKIIIQAARRKAKDQKNWDALVKAVDKIWAEEKLPHMLKLNDARDEVDLRAKLTKDSRSLDAIKESFRLDFIRTEYVRSSIKEKIKPDYPRMQAYYRSHISDFQCPAQVSWREMVARVDAETSRAAARQKADQWLARLRRGEDFARLAAAESQGATASKGGLWDKMLPNSYGVAAVNSALERLPIGQISQVIEGENGFHLIRVESRRAAGPYSFGEMQEKISEAVFREGYERELTALVAKLRARTVVIMYFDSGQGDPSVQRASATAPVRR